MYAPALVSGPSAPLLTATEARAHLRIDSTDEDAVLEGLIGAATAYLDGWSGILGRGLVTQTWRQDFDAFSDRLSLPLAPAASITHVKYYDGDAVLQTADPAVYALRHDGLGPYAARVRGQSWPSPGNLDAAVQVTFVAGYGATAASVPQAIRQAALMLVGHWYENREAVAWTAGQGAEELPLGVAALLAPFRRVGL